MFLDFSGLAVVIALYYATHIVFFALTAWIMNDINLDLPDILFVRHRLSQLGPLHYQLEPNFRSSMLSGCTEIRLPKVPDPETFALNEVMGLVEYYSRLIRCAPKRLSTDLFEALANRIIGLGRRSPDGMIAAILMCPWKEYVPHHAINTAILAAQMADALQLEAAEQKALVLAALMMNLGSIALHNEMAHQPEPPTTGQRQLLHIHPLVSSALIRDIGFDDELLHVIVVMHHEHYDGHGYPFKFKADKIPPLPHLLHVLDVAIAKLMPRSYRSRIPARTALAQLYRNASGQFNARYITYLIKVLGVFPSGSFVGLESGEIAAVVKQTDNANAPMVATQKRRYEPIDTTTPGQKIVKSVDMKVELQHLPAVAPFWPLNPA